jgi:hypothetical protein
MKFQWGPLSGHMKNTGACALGSSDFDIFLEIQHASCVFGGFGLEILRLVYKKVFFEIWNGFYLI